MADDYAENATTSGTLAIGGQVTGVLETSGDKDWFAVKLNAGLLYQFDITAASNFVLPQFLDTTIVDASGIQLAGTATNDRTIQYVPTTTGTYYVAVSAQKGTGAYTLTSGTADDYTADTKTTGRVAIGGQTTGVIERSNDTDWIAVDLALGFNYSFQLNPGADASYPSNISLRIRDGNAVFESVNYISNQNFYFTPNAAGTYYLEVNSGNYGLGSYTVSAIGDDYSELSSTVGRLAKGSSVTGVLEAPRDDDWFAVSLTAGTTYTFSLAAFASLTSTSSLEVILRNAVGAPLSSYGTIGRTLTFTPTATGTYYLDVSGGLATGSYSLTDKTIYAPVIVSPPNNANATPNANVTPVYRFFDSNFGTHFFTGSSSERDTILSTRPDLISEGVGLSALPASNDANVSPVYRFFDTIHGTQFVTSSATERDTITATRLDLHFEGISFYEYNGSVAGSTPVYRFFDTTYGTHFFTGSATERATIVATRADLKEEGIAFYSPSS